MRRRRPPEAITEYTYTIYLTHCNLLPRAFLSMSEHLTYYPFLPYRSERALLHYESILHTEKL